MSKLNFGATPKKTHVPCAYSGEMVHVDKSHRIHVGMSHYRKLASGEWEHSYSQVFATQHCSSRENAVARAHALIDGHADLPHGTVTPEHNPKGEHSHATVKMNVEYHPSHQAEADLPKVDAITGESLAKATEIFVPHVDDSSRGHCYQELLRSAKYPDAAHKDLTLGTATLANAIKLAHAIVDEIVQPSYEGKLK